MGIISGLIKAGVVAGAAVAAVKVSDRYKANNPDGITDKNEKRDAIKKAAEEIYQETNTVIKEKAPGVIDSISSAAKDAAPNLTAKAEEVFGKVKEAAPGVIDSVTVTAQQVYDIAREKAPGVTSKVEEFAGKAKEYIDTLDKKPVDAEIIEFETIKEAAEASAPTVTEEDFVTEPEEADIEVEVFEEGEAAVSEESTESACECKCETVPPTEE